MSVNPPQFSDLAKKFKDISTKFFVAGFFKASAKVPETNGTAVNIDSSYELANKAFGMNLECKTPINYNGLKCLWIEKWTNKNELLSSVQINPSPNLSNTLEVSYDPAKSNTTVKLKNAYKTNFANTSADILFKSIEPEISLNTVARLNPKQPLFGGASVTIDSKKHKMVESGYGLQYQLDNFVWSATVQNNKEFASQIYVKSSDTFQWGWETGWNRESKKTRFLGIFRHKLDSGSIFKTKFSSCGLVTLAYCFTLIDSVKLSFSVAAKSNNISSGGHQIGFKIEV